ncbi:MAG: hypothetical protein QOJ68_1939 [Blastococcus sp.]|nr:hypothetical protein [Blastococcus sp.]
MSSRSTTPAPRSTGGRRPRLRAAALVTGLAGALALGQAGIAAAAPVPVLPHGLGGVAPTTSLAASTGLNRLAEASLAAGGELRTAATLPASVDLTGFAVPPGDQGQHGACASWTTAYTMAGWESKYWHHAGAPFQPMFVYNQVNGGSDNGSTFPANFHVLETQGDLEAGAWTHPFSDYTSQPTGAERTNAAKHVMTPHTTLFMGEGQGVAARTAIESAIADNRPVAIGIPVYDSFFYIGPSSPTYGLASEAGYFEGYHAVTVLGYNAAGVRIENSWGSGWGAGGFATLGWDFVESEVFEAEAAGTFVATSLTPSVTALSQHVVSADGGAPLTIAGARLTSVDTSSPSAVTFVSVANPSVVANAPVTGSTSATLTVTVPALPAAGQYRVVVTGPDGGSLPNGTTDVVTAVHAYTVALAPGQAGRSNAAAWVTLTGSGFGTTLASFTVNQVSATVAGVPATVGWIDDTHLKVLVPAAPAGSTADLVLSRAGASSSPLAVPYLLPAPVVTRVSPARIGTAGGTSVTVTVANGTGSATSVALVLGNGSTITTPVTGRTATTITFKAPAAPGGLSQDRHVVVTNDGGGPSAPSSTDVLGYRVGLSAHASSSIVSAAGGVVRLTGSGFGSSAAAFAAAHVTATVNGVAARVSWVNAGALDLTVPTGKPGTLTAIVLLNDSIPGPRVSGPRYVAVITASTAPAGSRRGWTTTVRGVGLGAAHGWALLNGRGQVVRALPVVRTWAALGSARYGAVLITSTSTATVKLPTMSAGTYRLVFAPDQRAYPGASLAATPAALLAFR